MFSLPKTRPPSNFNLAIVGCFYPAITSTGTPSTTTSTGIPSSTTTQHRILAERLSTTTTTGTPSPTTTTTLPPTTTTMNYCTQENGMNQPLTIQPNQIKFNPTPNTTTPPGDINPTTTTTPGLNFPTMNPQINVTLNQPASLTVIYIPVDTPNKPSNVNSFTVVFVYPNNTSSPPLNSNIPSTGESTTTTTTPSGIPSQTTTTPIPSGVVPPSNLSPQVDVPPNFQVPTGTTIVITITSTTDKLNPTGVCICFSSSLSLLFLLKQKLIFDSSHPDRLLDITFKCEFRIDL
jgi:hypothetical protein